MLEEFLSVEDQTLMIVYIISEVLFIIFLSELYHGHDVVNGVCSFLLDYLVEDVFLLLENVEKRHGNFALAEEDLKRLNNLSVKQLFDG